MDAGTKRKATDEESNTGDKRVKVRAYHSFITKWDPFLFLFFKKKKKNK